MPDRKISELDSTTSVKTGAMFPLSQTEGLNLKTFKGTVEQIGDYIAKTQDHSTLNTTSKKIIGAINEILASGDIEGTASGSVASFADGGDNIPVKSLVAEIVASQAGSGTPSPSNPRAISGYTDVVIENDVQGTTQATYTISLGSTVYGGTLDVIKGILTVTHGIVDLGDLTWVYRSDNVAFYNDTIISDCAVNPTICLCSAYEFDADANSTSVANISSALSNLQMAAFSNAVQSGRVVVKDSNYTDANAFKTAVTGQKLTYPLATPVVVQLTPTEVVTLLGENNIYANSGDVEVEYFTNKANEIAELIEAEIASLSTDFHVYSTNEKVVGQWIDGKPLYEKTVNCGALPNNEPKYINHNISNIDAIVGMSGIAVSSGTSVNLPYPSSTSESLITLNANITQISIFTYRDRTSFTAYVTLRYTKTTD